MMSNRPYIMRALYEWILDNECTPYIVVNAELERVDVPAQYVKDGHIVLNVCPSAVIDLVIDNDALHFNGRFGGVATDVYVPMHAVVSIYARENGQGTVFETEHDPLPDPPSSEPPPTPPRIGKRPALKVIK